MQWYKEGYDVPDEQQQIKDTRMKVQAEVKQVFTRDVKGKTYYSVCFGGADPDDGSDLWASCGMTKPSCNKGDNVTADVQKDGKWWKVNAGDIKIDSTGGPKAVAGKGGGGGWNDPQRQKSIVAQSALKMSMEFIGLALEAGALALGAGKAPKKWEILNDAVAEKAKEFYFVALDPDEFFGDPEEVDDDDDDFSPVPD